MAKAPSPNSRNNPHRPPTPAKATLHAHGQYNSQVPIGRSIRINGAARTVVGILAADFDLPVRDGDTMAISRCQFDLKTGKLRWSFLG